MGVRPIRCLHLTGDRIKEKTVINNLNVPMKKCFHTLFQSLLRLRDSRKITVKVKKITLIESDKNSISLHTTLLCTYTVDYNMNTHVCRDSTHALKLFLID